MSPATRPDFHLAVRATRLCHVVGGARPHRRHPRARPSQRPALRLLAGIAVPVAAYVIVRRWLGSDALALAVASAIPIGWMLAVGLTERRIDPIPVAAAVVLGAALVISLASGGSALPLKLRRAAVTGSLGVACLISVLVGRPLLSVALDMLCDTWPKAERFVRSLRGADARREATVATAIIGVTSLCDAAAQVALALSVSTATFLGLTGLTRLAVFSIGLGVCALYLRGAARRQPSRAGSGADPSV